LIIQSLEAKETKINRNSSYGWRWKKIADMYGYVLPLLSGGLWLEGLGKRKPS
tara:strand:+ start:1269 stop:1427 length:159 start_codon:yes stop_codon:yes gene_type:complete